MTTRIQGELEIDNDRGVIYFHSQLMGVTIMRICRLPTPIPFKLHKPCLIDITHMVGSSYTTNTVPK